MSFSLVMLIARYLFLAILYWFLISVIRAIYRELRASLPSEPSAQPTAYLLFESGTEPVQGGQIPLGAAPCSIGREGDNQVCLPQSFVSARHARIQYRDGSWWLEDLGSTNGTICRGRQVQAPVKLREGDLIEIGDTTLRFRARK